MDVLCQLRVASKVDTVTWGSNVSTFSTDTRVNALDINDGLKHVVLSYSWYPVMQMHLFCSLFVLIRLGLLHGIASVSIT